jgi:hypothetical protein
VISQKNVKRQPHQRPAGQANSCGYHCKKSFGANQDANQCRVCSLLGLSCSWTFVDELESNRELVAYFKSMAWPEAENKVYEVENPQRTYQSVRAAVNG